MSGAPKRQFTHEYRAEAVKLVTEQGMQLTASWAVAFARAWDAGEISKSVVYNTSFIYYPVLPILVTLQVSRTFNLQYDVLPRLRKV